MARLQDVIGRGLLASRPSAGTAGRLYFATDGSGTLYRDNGSSWDSVETSASGLSDPMTTAYDLIYRNGSNTTARLAKGADGDVLSTLSGAVSWAASRGAKSLLDYEASTDIHNGTSITASTWTDVGTNQSFTVDDANAKILILLSGAMTIGNPATSGGAVYRVVVDSAGTPITSEPLGGGVLVASTFTKIGFAGAFNAGSLSAASHTVKVQLYTAASGETFYIRASSAADEALGIRVLQCR